jgi:hypothetical protein
MLGGIKEDLLKKVKTELRSHSCQDQGVASIENETCKIPRVKHIHVDKVL